MSRKKRIIYSILTVVLWILVWQVAAAWIHNQIFLPSPLKTVESLGSLLASAEFYHSVGISLGNIAEGFLLGVFAGICLAVLASVSDFFDTFIALPIRVIKATPVASFTILALFWIDSTELSVLISFFMVLPVIYTNVLTGIRSTDEQMLEMTKVFKVRLFDKVRFLYTPSVLPYLFSAVSVAIGLAWKSGIAAEVIGIAKNSIGNHLYQAKIFMEMPELFAWTFVTIVISILSEKLVLLCIRLLEKAVIGTVEETVENVQIGETSETEEQKNKEPEAVITDRKIIVSEVSKSYGEKKVLEKFSVTLSPEYPIALMGSSGIGKTTLLRLVLSLENADEGMIMREKNADEFAVVFQENRLFENVSVEQNLQMICKDRSQKEEIFKLLKRLGLYDCRKQRVSCLSGGMKRRVAIGRALLADAPVLLLDEPFQGLDVATRKAVMRLVKEKMQGKSVLLITHDEKESEFLDCEILRI